MIKLAFLLNHVRYFAFQYILKIVAIVDLLYLFQNLVDINQGLLAGVGVSHPALGQVVNVAAANGIHAKLTGAGGGGFALGLVTPAVRREQVHTAYSVSEHSYLYCQ